MKVLDSSVLEEERKGLNGLPVGVVFLGKKGSAGILGRSRSVKECKNPGAVHSWVVLDPWVAVMVMVGDARGCFNLVDKGL